MIEILLSIALSLLREHVKKIDMRLLANVVGEGKISEASIR